MNSFPLLYLSCILAGFALIRVPLSGFMEPLEPLVLIVGVLTILLFSCVLIYKGILCLVGKG
ncbi:hypothetical protein RYX56_00285 [Alkalihalophilus lindianensis]|uniref:Uncharacterized protein n=1 Tax=Alkalihalophilus lindianensis TaxID=1630542 RepID=A0ABU3X4I2_9BACI|nr:hypothetical protein [Alkalihalophilus lindianensis]